MGSGEYRLDWFPSEYLYREKLGLYCVALDISSQHELLIGGTLMRQHAFVFDIQNNNLGIARAKCNEDPNMILSEEELILYGQRYALDPTHTESLNIPCAHSFVDLRTPRAPKKPKPTQIAEEIEKKKT